jgi:hypothetical protein
VVSKIGPARKETSHPGLPDGLISNKKIPILEGLVMEVSGTFYGHLVNFPAMWYI